MKIGIVGSGYVGSTAAYAMVMRGIGRDIVLVDRDRARAEAEASDIVHAVPFAEPLRVVAGDYGDLNDSRVVIIAAGVGQKLGETRLQLLQRNAAVFREVIHKIVEQAPKAILLVATNPVDVMTHLAAHFAAEFDVPPSRVIGTGTTLDTARFRTLVGDHFGVDSQHVHAYVVGEHGDSEVLTWSLGTIAGSSLEEFGYVRGIELSAEHRTGIDSEVRRAAYRIIAGKGATYYGIGSALARIVDVILHNQRAILTVCTRIEEVLGVCDVTLSLPHLLGGEGIIASVPQPLDQSETTALRASAKVIRSAIDSLNL